MAIELKNLAFINLLDKLFFNLANSDSEMKQQNKKLANIKN